MARFTDRSQVSDALGIPFSVQQLDAITAPLEPGVIIAGAGSGKTTILTERVIRLLLGGAEPSRILCLTYTKAAAAELEEKLRTRGLRPLFITGHTGWTDCSTSPSRTRTGSARRLRRRDTYDAYDESDDTRERAQSGFLKGVGQ